MKYTIALIKGDGIGPEIVDSAVRVLKAVSEKTGVLFSFQEYLAGGAAIDATGEALPEKTMKGCLGSDSVLLGAVGGEKWKSQPPENRPEKALLALRKGMGLFTNLRPAKIYESLKDACPLRKDVAEKGFDMVIVRELTGGIYFGERGRREGKYGPEAYDTEAYSVMEIERIAGVAFETAMKRKKRVISVDKANVLETSRLWRETVHRVGQSYPEVELEDMLVDNAAMQLIRNPQRFDVMVTSNMFGDILSDEASQLTGSIGMLPSASLGKGRRGIYEPIHGSAPDIAGRDIANPIATILSAEMMLRYAFDLPEEAAMIDRAVNDTLNAGFRTVDIYDKATCKKKPVGTVEMTDEIIKRL